MTVQARAGNQRNRKERINTVQQLFEAFPDERSEFPEQIRRHKGRPPAPRRVPVGGRAAEMKGSHCGLERLEAARQQTDAKTGEHVSGSRSGEGRIARRT